MEESWNRQGTTINMRMMTLQVNTFHDYFTAQKRKADTGVIAIALDSKTLPSTQSGSTCLPFL